MGFKELGTAIGISVAIAFGGIVGDVNTSETNAQGLRSETPITRESRTTSKQQSGIIAGEWELEGDSMWDLLFVNIERDPYGSDARYIDQIDPDMIAAEMGFPFIGEPRAPEDCRLFTFGGPMGIPMVIGFCTDGDYTLYVGGTDIDVIREVMYEFNAGDPFTVPYGYTRSY